MNIRSRILPLGAALLAAGLLSACATDGVHARLERAHALSAAGQYGEAWRGLQKASEDFPGNAELHNAALSARERFATQLQRRADSALADRRFEDARTAYRQLSALPGYEAKAREGLDRLQGQMDAPVTRTVVPEPAPVSLAVQTPSASPSSSSAATQSAASASVSSASASIPLQPVAPVAAPQPASASASSPVVSNVSAQQTAPAITPRVVTVKPVATPESAPVDPMARKVTLEFRDASVRSLFDVIAKASGLNVIFDREVSPDLRTTVYLRNTTVRSAIEKIVLTSGLAWRNLDENTLLVYTDEGNKQRDYQALVVRGFQLANADAKFVANSLKTVLKFRDLIVDEKLNMIVVRDTAEAIAMADKLIALHDVAEPEVMLEVTILEVGKGKLQNLGVAWPGSLSLSPLARTVSSTSSTVNTTSGIESSSTAYNLTLRDLYNLSPSSLSLGMGATTLNFNATDSDLNVLANPRIRAKSKEKAKILIGERVPNISATATSNGVVSQNITYVDVGLKLDVEPQVFPGNEIALKINMEVSSINSTVENKANGSVAYRIGTRNAATVLRLKDGENQILAGLIQDSDRKSVSKVPLLGDVPLLGRLFRSDSDDKNKTEIVLSITPRLIRGNKLVTPEAATFDGGTLSSLRGRREGDSASSSSVIEYPAISQPVQSPIAQPPSPEVNRANSDTSSRRFGGSSD